MSKSLLVFVAALGSVVPAQAGHGCFGGQVGYGCVGSGWQPVGYGCVGSGWQPAGYACLGSGWQPVGYGCVGSGWHPVGYGCVGSGWQPAGYGCYGSGLYAGAPVSYGGEAWSGPYGLTPAATVYYEDRPVGTPVRVESEVRRTREVQAPAYREVRRDNGRQEVREERRPAPAPEHRAADSRRPAEPGGGEEQSVKGEEQSVQRLGPPEGESAAQAPATLTVRLPADAKLSINQVATRAGSAARTFQTPPLKPGKEYYYTLKAEAVRDGQALAATERVAVRAGEKKQVVLQLAPAGAASP